MSGQPVEDVLAHLRQSDERVRSDERTARGRSREPRRRPCAPRSRGRRCTSTPRPDSSSHSRPSCHRGEWGMHMPRLTNSPDGHVERTPPSTLFSRQPSTSSVSPSAVTNAGLVVDDAEAVEVAAVLGGERGDERRSPAGHEAVAGRRASARHEKRVFTTQSSSPTYARSWIRMSPVVCECRGMKHASWRSASSSRGDHGGLVLEHEHVAPSCRARGSGPDARCPSGSGRRGSAC